jgi:4a-hydroxytetrahydrobiopterin dehydratase
MPEVLDDQQIQAALAERPHWEYRDNALVRVVKAADFMAGIRTVDEVAVVAESLNHHPDIDIRYTDLTFALTTHSEGGVTANDVEMAGRIDQILADAG